LRKKFKSQFLVINECANQAHDCSPFAECVDATDGFACICKEGFVDISSQHELLPGRRCSNGLFKKICFLY